MRRLLLLLAAAAFACTAAAQPYVPTPDNLPARARFQQHRLGIFLHWGLYASYAQGEWYLQTGGLNKVDYAVAADTFNPVKFDADAWLAAFKDAGAGYITFTSRHHDGFSMFKTATSPYNIVDGTPFRRDVVGELARASAKAGLDFHLYSSVIIFRSCTLPKHGISSRMRRPARRTWRLPRRVRSR